MRFSPVFNSHFTSRREWGTLPNTGKAFATLWSYCPSLLIQTPTRRRLASPVRQKDGSDYFLVVSIFELDRTTFALSSSTTVHRVHILRPPWLRTHYLPESSTFIPSTRIGFCAPCHSFASPYPPALRYPCLHFGIPAICREKRDSDP